MSDLIKQKKWFKIYPKRTSKHLIGYRVACLKFGQPVLSSKKDKITIQKLNKFIYNSPFTMIFSMQKFKF